MPYAALSPARFGLLCKSSTGFAVLASLLFVGMAPPSLAQSPLAIPSNLESALLLASGPPRVTVHPRPHLYRRCTRWYLVQYSPSMHRPGADAKLLSRREYAFPGPQLALDALFELRSNLRP